MRPLYFELLDESQAKYARSRLIAALNRYGWRLGTGFLSTPLILYVLADIDIESAYRLLENEQMPGWLFMPKVGATTIWENWEGTEAEEEKIASLDHYSKGAMCQWLFDTMCGIRLAGENCFSIAPHPGGHFSYASFVYESVYGTVESRWERESNGFVYTISVPANCTASLSLPSGQVKQFSAGNFVFRDYK